jgi:signal transduction histidine kinase
VVGLETRLEVARITSPEVSLFADPDQLEQALINLVRNAVDAVLERASTTANLPSAETAAATEPRPAALPSATPTAPPGVRLGWTIRGGDVEVQVEDDGPGLASTANLFVPFFTTKPRGSGIGLALSRQIAESHGGSLTLENRPDHTGCIARLRLPLASAPSAGGHG